MAPDAGIKAMDEAELVDALIELPGWELKGKQIVKSYTFKDFLQAMEFVNRVAETAQADNHHPDIHITYNKVKIACWTHKFNGVSRLDTKLAARIDGVFESS
ncbi:4a-hydroxytetrahydrobiopterin dehydratase [Candidatus Sumerlaeota bacterium]|nr:4a-hydroxytetrahydrobiopterin dehydratase [Candidatus Sumerlaeota bacterium]